MPVAYEYDRRSGVIRTRCYGSVTFHEVVAHFRELEVDPDLPPRLDILLDLSAMESLPASGQLKIVSTEMGRLQSRVKWGACAIVASRDALYGMSRMFQVLAADQFESSHVFREIEEAERWLSSAREPLT